MRLTWLKKGTACGVRLVLLAAFVLFGFAGGGLAQGPWQETIVGDIDNGVSDGCGGLGLWWGQRGLSGGLLSWVRPDLDSDGSVGGVEDGDGDELFGSIGAAIANTSPGGVVEIVAPGIYRENLTITSSIALRAPEGVKVVLEGGLGLCLRPPGATGITVQGDVDVTIQNLTIRGYVSGLVTAGAEGSPHVTVRNCRFENNETAGINHVRPSLVSVFDTTFIGPTPGLGLPRGILAQADAVKLQVSDSEFDHLYRGVDVAAANRLEPAEVTIHDSRFVDMTDTGIYTDNTDLVVTDTLVTRCYFEGIYAVNAIQAGATDVTLEGNRIEMNGRDGVRVNAAGGAFPAVIRLAFSRNVVSHNGGIGLNMIGPATILDRAPGENVVTYNTGGTWTAGGPGSNNCVAVAVSTNMGR